MALSEKVVLTVGAIIAVAVGYYALSMSAPTPIVPSSVWVGDTVIAVEVANTPESRVQGLSGRADLAQGSGLLFDFFAPDYYRIWMKDMNFSIDIVWANDGRVITVEHDVSPNTFPQNFTSAAPARYVLELPAGYAAMHGIAEGGEFVVQ